MLNAVMGALLITRESDSDIAGASVPTEFDYPFPAAGTACTAP
jgi:hypothetical protein